MRVPPQAAPVDPARRSAPQRTVRTAPWTDARRLAQALGNAAFARAAVARMNGEALAGTSSGTPPSRLQSDVRRCMLATWTQRQLGRTAHANWPEPGQRRTVSEETFAGLEAWFLALRTDLEMSRYFPPDRHRWEVATSGSTRGVHDLKISPLDERGNARAAVFNYHIAVAPST